MGKGIKNRNTGKMGLLETADYKATPRDIRFRVSGLGG